MQVTTQTKQCPKCNEIKPLDDFGKDKNRKYGVTKHCKICKREYEARHYRENPEKKREYGAKYRQENSEKIRERRAKHRLENPGKERESLARYRLENAEKLRERAVKYHARCRQENPERLREHSAKYRQEHPEKTREYAARGYRKDAEKRREYSKKYRQENPEKTRDSEAEYRKRNRPKKTAIQMKRHATKMQATPAWADFAAIEAIYFEAARLTQETGVQHVVDHVHPLQGYKYGICGLHVASNLKVITRSENQRKHNKFTPYVESECISTPTF